MAAGKTSSASLIAPPVSWLSAEANEGDAILGCRLELARNLADLPFPRAATQRQLREAAGLLRKSLQENLPGISFLPGDSDLGGRFSRLLSERWLVDADFSAGQPESGLWLTREQELAVAVNHEEHLRVRAYAPGFDLQAPWCRAERAVADLTSQLPVAFLPKPGYLTSCPQRVGSGLQISIVSHLPALVLSQRFEAVLRAAEALGVEACGAFVREKRVSGHFVQFTWQSRGKRNPEETLAAANSMLRQLIRGERAARAALWREKRDWLYDYAGRAYGILRHGQLLSEDEMFGLLSGMRLGCCLGLFSRLRPADLDALLVGLRDAHLAAESDRDGSSPPELDQRRSLKLRQFLSERLRQAV